MKAFLSYFQTRLQGRLILYFLPLLIVPVVGIALLTINTTSGIIIDNVKQDQANRLGGHLDDMNLFLETTEGDIRYLAESPNVLRLARAIADDSEAGVAQAKQLLEQDFAALSSAKKIYAQVRFISVDGFELVRVNNDGETASVSRELQYKGDRDYFTETSRLLEGEVYVSPLELTREGTPPTIFTLPDGSGIPTLRYGTPIYVDEQLIGVIVLNIYAQNLLDLIAPNSQDEEVFLLNADGYFLYDSEHPAHAFGFEDGVEAVGGEAGITIFDETEEFTGDEASRLLIATNRANSIETESNLLTYYARIAPPSAPDSYYWIVTSSRDTDVIFSDVQTLTKFVLTFVVALIILATGALIYFSRQLTYPILVLAERARLLASGERVFLDDSSLKRRDEIGVLNTSFTNMASQLQQNIDTLESRVKARTNDLATSAEIAAAANQVRDVEDLLSLTVNLIRDRFDFYYVQVYLVDQSQKWAVLHDGTGYIGRRLMARNHRLPLDGNSLVAKAIRKEQASLVQDTRSDESFLPNDLLPDTRSEITIPLRSKSGIIGVLDIQHNVANQFDETAAALFQSMADQLAVTFENVELLDTTRRRASELETVARVSAEATSNLDTSKLLFNVSNLVRDSFGLYHAHIYLIDYDENVLRLVAGAGEAGRLMVEEQRTIPLDAEQSIVARAARTRSGIIANNITENPNFLPHPALPDTKAEMAIPMSIGDKVIGVLDVQANVIDRFTDEDVKVKSTLAAQLAVAVQNARSYELTEKRAAELAVVAEVSAEISSTLDTKHILQTVSDLSKERFNLYHAHVYLMNEQGTRLILTAGAGEIGRAMVAENRTIKRDNQQSIVARAAREKTGVIVNDVTDNPDFLPHPLLPDTRAEMAIPIILNDAVVGVLDVQSSRVGRFTDEDVRIQTTLSDQIAVAITNAQSFERSRKRAIEIETVAQVGAEITTNLDVDQLLWRVANLARENFNLYHAHVYLTNLDATRLVLAAGAGQAGREMVMAGHAIAIDSETSIVARAFRDKEALIVNDVASSPTFLPNPLLPETRAEMAIPILLNDAVIGILDVQASVIHRFNQDDIRIQTILAEQLAQGIQNARLFEETQSRLRDLQVTSAISEYSRVDDDLIIMVENSMEVIRDVFGADTAVYSTFNPTDLTWNGVAGVGTNLTSEMAQQFMDVRDNYPHAVRALETGEVVPVNNTSKYPGFPVQYIEMLNLKSVLVLPIFTDNAVSGVIFFNYVEDYHTFTEQELSLARGLANQLSISIESKQAEQELLLYADVMTNTPSGIYVWRLEDEQNDASLRMVVANKASEMATGYPIQQVLGKLIYDGFPELVGTELPLIYANIARGGPPVDLGELEFDSEQRGHGYYLIRAFPLPRQSVGVSFENVTERKLIEKEVQKRASELATVAEVGAEVTSNLNVVTLLQSVSDLTKERFGLYHAHIYLLDEIGENLVLAAGAGEAGEKMTEAGHAIPLDREHSVVARAARERKGLIVNDITQSPTFLPNPLLPDTQAEMAVPMIVGDELIGILDVQSASVERFTEDDIRVHGTLAAQVGVAVQNARSFAEMQRQAEREHGVAERLREVDRLKSQFLANMSHELRTPLNSIIGYSEVLLDGVDGDLTDDAEEDVQAIHDSGKHLLSIINEILDLAKIEAGEMKLDRKSVDIVDFTREIIRNGQVLVKDKPVILEMVEEVNVPQVYADPIRLRQILWNLVSNAVKFTESGSVRVHLNMRDDNTALFTVNDTGVGMTEAGLGVIFQRFSQVDGSSTRRAGGTGLGLTITKQLVEMHGGQIDVTSVFGEGTTFWFTLPIHVPEVVSGD